MASPFAHFRTFISFAIQSLRERRHYRSLADSWQAFRLRLEITNLGKKLLPARQRPVALHLPSYHHPIYVRPATSDIVLIQHLFMDEEYGTVKGWRLPADAVVVDLGGNVGYATRYFSRLYPQMRAVAIEPDAGNAAALENNCAPLIDQGRLKVVQAFISAQDGQAGIDRSVAEMGFHKAAPGEAAGGEMIPCISMSSLLTAHGIERIDLLKCDIEGGEAELFADCRGWISKVRHLVVETHPPYSPDDLYNDLRKGGWTFEITRHTQRDEYHDCFLRWRDERDATEGNTRP